MGHHPLDALLPAARLDEHLVHGVWMTWCAASGRTVVAVIHQPRSSIFDMLDDLVRARGPVACRGEGRST